MYFDSEEERKKFYEIMEQLGASKEDVEREIELCRRFMELEIFMFESGMSEKEIIQYFDFQIRIFKLAGIDSFTRKPFLIRALNKAFCLLRRSISLILFEE